MSFFELVLDARRLQKTETAVHTWMRTRVSTFRTPKLERAIHPSGKIRVAMTWWPSALRDRTEEAFGDTYLQALGKLLDALERTEVKA